MKAEFADKVCVVTGGAAGIGEAVCLAFAAEGARVAVLDVNADKAAAMAARMDGAAAFACDVSESSRVEATVENVMRMFGRIDVLVNNAGIIGGAEYRRNLDRRVSQMQEFDRDGAIVSPLNAVTEMTDAQWRRMLSIHLDGTFYCTRAALRHMQPKRSGAIVNMASVVGLDGGVGVPHYAAAKAGIIGFTRAVAQEVAPLGIRVNAVAPGFIATGMRDRLPQSMADAHLRATPMGRLGTPSEIAHAVVYLAGSHASFIAGQVLSPNGAYLCR